MDKYQGDELSTRDGSGDDKEKSGIDLGLSSLLSLQKDVAPMKLPPQSEESPSSPQSALSSITELGKLAAAKDWDELLKVSEFQLTVSQSIEARAWWVYAHLKRKSMPTAFLAAPFENLLLGNLSGISEHDRELLSKVGSLLSERLAASDEQGLAGVIREKLKAQKLTFVPQSPITGELNTLAAKTVDSTDEHGIVANGIASRNMTSEAVHLANLTGLQHLVTQATISQETASSKITAVGQTRERGQGASKKFLVVGGACATCMALGFVMFYRDALTNFTSLPVSVASEEFYTTKNPVELLAPELKRRDIVGSLTALFYSIEGTPTAVAAASTTQHPTTAPQPSTIPSDTSHLGTAPPPSSNVPVVPGGLEKVITDGPVEPESVRGRIQGRRELPRLPTVEKPRRDTTSGSKADKNSPFGKKPRDEIVMGIPEPDPSDGIRYQVMARTMVLSEPHQTATSVGRLLPGDIIIVERRIGDWLKLRSIKGRPGYVLAQDVAGAPYEEYRR